MILRTWHLVGLGVAFNFAAALMTGVLIDRQQAALSALALQQAQKEQHIEQLWQRRQEAERRREFLLLWLASAERPQRDWAVVATPVLAPYGGLPDNKPMTLQAVQTVFDQHRLQLERAVDDAYLSAQALQTQREPLARRIERWRLLALALQMVGLMLVLARDLGRR